MEWKSLDLGNFFGFNPPPPPVHIGYVVCLGKDGGNGGINIIIPRRWNPFLLVAYIQNKGRLRTFIHAHAQGPFSHDAKIRAFTNYVRYALVSSANGEFKLALPSRFRPIHIQPTAFNKRKPNKQTNKRFREKKERKTTTEGKHKDRSSGYILG